MENKKSENPFSKTVILPKTDFPMKAQLATREEARIQFWLKSKLFTKMKEIRKGRPSFLLHDGPPYANGNFHLGHSLNKTLKDIIVKSKHLSGFQVDFIPGWDCHGLPIEVQVLKSLGKEAHTISASEIRKKCREYANKFINIQGNDLSRFLCFWDPDRKYLTMDKSYQSKIAEVFGRLFKAGYIYRGKKPVYWDITLETAHAEAEIEYHDHVSPSIYVKFPVVAQKDLSCLIWTTTPWTLPANLGICFNEQLKYSVYESTNHGQLILCDDLKESVEKDSNVQLKKLRSLTSEELKNMKFHHPFLDKVVIPMFGLHVTSVAGTGCVHTAPGHGHDDYKVGMEYDLDTYCPVDSRGRYTDEFPLMKGMNIFDANPKIIELLKEKNVLLHNSEIKHSYPHSWRSKKPLIFRATPQWFFNLEHNGLRKRVLEIIDQTNWIPKGTIARIRSMVENCPDWCLSRQRNWGVPIPSFTCKSCGEIHINEKVIDHFVNLVQSEGIEVWYDWETQKLLPDGTKCAKCSGTEFSKQNDILDVWFDSGVSHFSVLNSDQAKSSPADMYLEGSDQHRGWFQSSLWTSVALNDFAPYKSVLTHGFILDEQGRPMSKSLGNVIDPQSDVVKIYGSDILRLWVCSQDFRIDAKIGVDRIKEISEQYRKIRNTFKYLLGNLADHKKEDNLSKEKLTEFDQYYLSLFAQLVDELRTAYNNYQFHLIYHKVLNFCIVNLSQDYFEIIRDRMYCDKKDSIERRSSSTVLSLILETLAIYLAPVLSFTMEEVWEFYGNKESIFLSEFPDLSTYKNPAIEEKYNSLLEVKENVNKALEQVRQKGKLGKSLEAKLFLQSNGQNQLFTKFSPEELELIFVVSQVELKAPDTEVLGEVQTDAYTISITKPSQGKCPRCWRHTKDIQKDGDLCNRCKKAIE